MRPQRTDDTFVSDKHAQHWAGVIARSSPERPLDLDDALRAHDPMLAKDAGKVSFPLQLDLPGQPDAPTMVCPTMGVLLDDVDAPMTSKDCAQLGVKLASLAIEKECDVIVLSHQHISGFERLGFRVDRIAGSNSSEREACLAQLRQFWAIDVMI